ncbi:MAG: SPASM domain-containing protein [Limisphaerales bacterium]
MFGKASLRSVRRRLASSLPGQVLRYGWDGRLDHRGFPRWVHIENTNHCPARCSMCSMDKMLRPTGFMKLGLFERIVDECARHPQVEQIHLHGFGEPLLDKNLPARIRYVKEHSRSLTYLVTTINLMTESFARDLISSGLDGMKVSLYGNTKATYESVHRRLNFEKTVGALETFLRVRDEMRAPNPRLRVQFAEGLAPAEELEPWARRWGAKLDKDRGDVLLNSTLHNWVGSAPTGAEHFPEDQRRCTWPFHDIQILWDGRVSPCVFDYDGTTCLGDANQQTIRAIWIGAPYENFRAVWRGRKSYSIPMCKACDAPDGKFKQVPLAPELQPKSRGIVGRNGAVKLPSGKTFVPLGSE